MKSCWLAAQLGSKKDLPEFCFIAPATSISTTQLAAATYRCKFLQSHDSFFTNSLHHHLRASTSESSPSPASSISESTLVCFPRLTFSERLPEVNGLGDMTGSTLSLPFWYKSEGPSQKTPCRPSQTTILSDKICKVSFVVNNKNLSSIHLIYEDDIFIPLR